jgi:hypothetical protein
MRGPFRLSHREKRTSGLKFLIDRRQSRVLLKQNQTRYSSQRMDAIKQIILVGGGEC